MLALAAAIAGRNMIRNDDEEEEGVPQIFDSALVCNRSLTGLVIANLMQFSVAFICQRL